MSYTTPISAGEVIYHISGYNTTARALAECEVTCDTDLLYAFIAPAGSNMNAIGIGFCALPNANNTNRTITFTWTRTTFNNDNTTDIITTSKSVTGGATASSLAWYKNINTKRFTLACEPPLNVQTGFVDFNSTTQEMAKDFILNKFEKETGNADKPNLWCSTVQHSGATYVGADTTHKATLTYNTKLFVDVSGAKLADIETSGLYDTNLDALQNMPLSNFFGSDYSVGLSLDYGQAYLLYYGLTVKPNNFKFDVYLDGNTEPNIGITWNKESADGSWNGQLTDVQIWLYTNGSAYRLTDGTSPYPQKLYYKKLMVNIPNIGGIDDNGNDYLAYYVGVEKPFDAGKYNTTWASVDSAVWGNVGKVERALQQGVGGTDNIYIVCRLKYKLLNENEDAWTSLHIVTVPKELPSSPSEIVIESVEDSKYALDWNVEVIAHFGEAPEDNDPRNPSDPSDPNKPYDPYDPYNPPDPSGFSYGDGTITSGALTTTYAMSVNRLKALGNKLWTQSYFDVLRVQNNPIENIISVKAFPFDISGVERDIVIGDVSMGVNGLECVDTYKLTVGSGIIQGFYNNFLDFAPFTSLTIFLPYIGFKELDLSKLVNTTLKVEYVCDFITGACKAILYSNNLPTYEFDGTIGIDIPLTSSDRAQTDIKHLQNIVNGSAQLLTRDVLGAVNTALSSAQMQYTSDTTSGGSPSCASYSCRNVYLIYNRPYFSNIASFNHVHGRASKKTATLSTLKGFTMTSREIDLSGIGCLSEERDMIRDLLSNGIYL